MTLNEAIEALKQLPPERQRLAATVIEALREPAVLATHEAAVPAFMQAGGSTTETWSANNTNCGPSPGLVFTLIDVSLAIVESGEASRLPRVNCTRPDGCTFSVPTKNVARGDR